MHQGWIRLLQKPRLNRQRQSRMCLTVITKEARGMCLICLQNVLGAS